MQFHVTFSFDLFEVQQIQLFSSFLVGLILQASSSALSLELSILLIINYCILPRNGWVFPKRIHQSGIEFSLSFRSISINVELCYSFNYCIIPWMTFNLLFTPPPFTLFLFMLLSHQGLPSSVFVSDFFQTKYTALCSFNDIHCAKIILNFLSV